MGVAVKNNHLKYKVVYDQLISKINGGHFQIGERLPSERMLAERLNVNMATIRRAFKELKISGIVEKKVGFGTYWKSFLNDEIMQVQCSK